MSAGTRQRAPRGGGGDWLHAHASLFTSCHLTFGIFVGKGDDADPNPVHRRWRVNIEALVERIERFSRS